MSLLGIPQPFAQESVTLPETSNSLPNSLDLSVFNFSLQVSQILQWGSGVQQSSTKQLVQRGQLMSQAVEGLRWGS